MTFMIKKKRFKFEVDFEVEELSSVPLVSGALFVKVRLLDGGSFTQQSLGEEVSEHRVRWNSKFSFHCKMVAASATGVLEPCVCRISVRKELKGGRSYQKLGFADVNLAQYAGAGRTVKRCLLEGYDSKRRQDNSMLKVIINTQLLSGDPCFKVPRSETLTLTGSHDLHEDNKGLNDDDNQLSDHSNTSESSSGFSSLPRSSRQEKQQPLTPKPHRTGGSSPELAKSSLAPATAGGSKNLRRHSDHGLIDLCASSDLPEGQGRPSGSAGHSRNSSSTSQQSKCSGYHSRQSSNGSESLGNSGHHRNLSLEGSKNDPSVRPKKKDTFSSLERRVDTTRVDNDELIDQLIEQHRFDIKEDNSETGLQLIVSKDGSTALSSSRNQQTAGGSSQTFQPVIINR